MSEAKDPIRPTTPEAIQLAKSLLRAARHGAIAVLDSATRRPLASRVAVATDIDGTPIVLVSGLAAHTPGLIAHPACSLLLGEAGKGDPLAHPRITFHCEAIKVDQSSEDYSRIRRRYLNHNPKGSLYVNLGDFCFFRLAIESASLNGGFGKAFNLSPGDLLCDPRASTGFAEEEQAVLDNFNQNHADEVAHLAKKVVGNTYAFKTPWRVIGLDPDGVDLANGDMVARLFFESSCDSPGLAVKTLAISTNKVP